MAGSLLNFYCTTQFRGSDVKIVDSSNVIVTHLTADSDEMYIGQNSSAPNVGIGITDPDDKLHVNGNIRTGSGGTSYGQLSSTGTYSVVISGTTVGYIYGSGSNFYIQPGSSGGTLYIGAPASQTSNLNVQGKATLQTIDNATSDTDKFLVSDSGEIKYRTGAEVRADIGAGTGDGTVTGSGTADRVVKFTTASAIGNSEIVDTGSSITMGKDASAQSTLYLDTDNRKVGFRTTSPGSAFDVNGTMRVRNQLNVGHTTEQNLYVNGNGSAGGQYVKMGNYGSGNYFGITSSENQPKYCASFGSAGKIVEDMRIVTIKLSGNAFKLLKTTGTTLLAAPGANSFIIPYECIIHNSGGTSGNWNSSTSTTAAIGFCDNVTCTYPGQFNRLFVINNTLLNTNAAWYYAAGIATTGKAMALNKPLLLKASQDITTAPTGSWYIQIRYQVMNKDSGLVNNVDITKTTN